MSVLPKGWVTATLDDLCLFNPRHNLSIDRSTEVSFIPMPSVSDMLGTIEEHEIRQLGEVRQGYTHFQDGDVIFAKITPCMENGKIAVAEGLRNGLACGSTEFHVLRTKGAIAPKLLWYFLRQKSFRDDAERHMTGAVGQRRVPAQYMKNIEFSLPPLAEQRRIVAELDSLFARTRRARAELARIPSLVEHYKQAILAAAFRGDLTADWRSTHSADITPTLTEHNIKTINGNDLTQLPPGWAWVTADELCEIKTGIALGKKRSAGTELIELPYLRVANVQRGWLDLNEVKTTFVTTAEAERLYLRPGDILMNEGGDRDKLGRGWVWDGQIEPCIHQNHVFRLRLNAKEMSPYYVSYFANELGKDFFLQQGKQTTNLASISLTKLSSLPIPLAPLEEMNLIVERIESAIHSLAKVEAETRKAIHLLDHLDQANLAKAFRGELVPQDPNDEPASALLERIRTEQARQSQGKGKNRQLSLSFLTSEGM